MQMLPSNLVTHSACVCLCVFVWQATAVAAAAADDSQQDDDDDDDVAIESDLCTQLETKTRRLHAMRL